MEDLYNVLTGGGIEFLSITIYNAGFDLTINSEILTVEEYQDGFTLYLEGESTLFISSLINKVVSVEEFDERTTQYVLRSVKDTIIEIRVVKREG